MMHAPVSNRFQPVSVQGGDRAPKNFPLGDPGVLRNHALGALVSQFVQH